MLLSIDRVLQLLGDGKSLEKIAEMADCETKDVIELVEKARTLLSKYEKNASRRKLIIKKKSRTQDSVESSYEPDTERDIFAGAELSVIPVQSSLVMYVSGVSDESNKSGIGIVITDRDGKQIGKVSLAVPASDDFSACLAAVKKSLKIAEYFSTSGLKIRTHMVECIKYIEGDEKVQNKYEKYDDQLGQIKALLSAVGKVQFESISLSQNDKADFFAVKSVK